MKWLFGCLSLLFVSFCFGIRVHPENVSQIFYRPSFDHYDQIEFFSGLKLAGKIISESADTLEIGLGTGTAVFNKGEIKSRHGMDPQAVKDGKYPDVMIQEPLANKPLVSLRYQDSVFYVAENKIDRMLSRAAEKMSGPGKVLNAPQAEGLAPGETSSRERMLPEKKLAMPRTGEPDSLTPPTQDYEALLRAGLEKLQSSTQ